MQRIKKTLKTTEVTQPERNSCTEICTKHVPSSPQSTKDNLI